MRSFRLSNWAGVAQSTLPLGLPLLLRGYNDLLNASVPFDEQRSFSILPNIHPIHSTWYTEGHLLIDK